MINKLIPEHCPISDESLDYYRKSLPTYRTRKALGDFPQLLPVNEKPQASHDFALSLQAGLSRLTSPVLWLSAACTRRQTLQLAREHARNAAERTQSEVKLARCRSFRREESR